MKTTTIAILGSTSHIAKGLIINFLQYGEYCLHLYTKSPDKLNCFLRDIGKLASNFVIYDGYENFAVMSHDVIINCVGVGTLSKFNGDYTKYFTVTEEFDNLVIGYLCICRPDALYISFSSGAVYGRDFYAPVEEGTKNCIRVNHVASEDYYAIARLYAEAKHRAFYNLKIVDLRIFSYFSRFIDLTDGYFITEILNCILNRKILVTDASNIVRDYIHPDDLFSAVKRCMTAGKINKAFDVTSSKPVEKNEILDYFSLEYGLKYELNETLRNASPTGSKNVYFSKYNNAASIGYKPNFSSMDLIAQESKYILG